MEAIQTKEPHKVLGLPPALWGVLFAVFALYAWPLALPGFVGHDADRLFLFYPAQAFARAHLLAGNVPLWNPFKFLGSPFLANLMVPVFYPPQFLGLVAPQPFGQNMALLFHAMLAAALAWGCARRGFGIGRAGAAMAALSFAGSAPMFVHLTHPNQFFAAAWLPGVLWAARGLDGFGLRGPRWLRGGAVLGLVMGLQGLAGQPQISLYGGAIVFCATLFAARGGWRAFARACFAAMLGGALAFGLAAVELMPGLELSRFSHRQLMGADYSTSFSLPFKALAGLVAPGFAPKDGGGEVLIFFGQGALALAAAGFVARLRKPTAWLLAAIALVGLLMALGGNTPLYARLMKIVPILQSFRAPARAFILCVLAGAMLAGMGMDWAAAWTRRRNWSVAAVAAALLLIQFGALAWNRAARMPQPYETSEPLAEAGLLAPRVMNGSRIFRLMDDVDYLDARPASVDEKIYKLQADANMLAGQPEAFGYDEGSLPTAQFLLWVHHYWQNLYTAWPDPNVLGLMGVRCVMADKPVGGKMLRRVASLDDAAQLGLIAPPGGAAGRRLREAVATGKIGLYQNLAWRGLVFTREDWPEVDWNAVADLGAAGESKARRDIMKPLPESQRANPPPPALPGAPRVAAAQAPSGDVAVRALASDLREIIFSTTALPGWEAQLPDGARVAGRPITACLIAFDLPAGTKNCTLVYCPRSFRIGAGVSLVSFALLAGFFAATRRRKTGITSQEDAQPGTPIS